MFLKECTPKKAEFEAGEAEWMGENGDIGPAQEPLGESVFTFSALNLNKSVNDRDQTGIRIVDPPGR